VAVCNLHSRTEGPKAIRDIANGADRYKISNDSKGVWVLTPMSREKAQMNFELNKRAKFFRGFHPSTRDGNSASRTTNGSNGVTRCAPPTGPLAAW